MTWPYLISSDSFITFFLLLWTLCFHQTKIFVVPWMCHSFFSKFIYKLFSLLRMFSVNLLASVILSWLSLAILSSRMPCVLPRHMCLITSSCLCFLISSLSSPIGNMHLHCTDGSGWPLDPGSSIVSDSRTCLIFAKWLSLFRFLSLWWVGKTYGPR